MYDLIIIGAGPAAMSAAIYASRREMKTLVIGKEIGGQMIWASEIENYPGFKNIASFDLIMNLKEQVEALGVEIKMADIKEIKKENDVFFVSDGAQSFQAKTVILALGLLPRKLGIPKELELNGKGISYCANCDGPFYKGKVAAVAGGGNAALDAAEVLSKIASKVYLIHRNEKFKAFNVLVDEVKKRENIELVLNAEIQSLVGENKLEQIVVQQNGEKKTIITDALFVEIGRIASTDLVSELVERDERNQIIIDNVCATKTPGLFACGDVTPVKYKQITVAVGQGTIAALSAYEYLQLKAEK
jgi:thioredoxin-disulfide reductase